MGMMSLISDTKRRFRERQTNQNVRKAESLENLRKERIRLEGYAKVAKAEEKEKAKIAKAKSTMRKNSKVAKLAKGLQKHMNKRKESGKGIQFGGSGPDFGGSGLNYGGSGINTGGSGLPLDRKPLNYGGKNKK